MDIADSCTVSRERELALNHDIIYNDILKVQVLLERDLSGWLEGCKNMISISQKTSC